VPAQPGIGLSCTCLFAGVIIIIDNSDRLVGNINEKDGESNLFGAAIVRKLKNHIARLYGRVSIGKEKGPMAKNP
jgi:hypothetical protein